MAKTIFNMADGIITYCDDWDSRRHRRGCRWICELDDQQKISNQQTQNLKRFQQQFCDINPGWQGTAIYAARNPTILQLCV